MARRRPAVGLSFGWLLVMAVALAGCVSTGGASTGQTPTPGTGQTPTPGPTSTPSLTPAPSDPSAIAHPTGSGDLVLRLETLGGFVAPTFRFTTYPTVSVYGDGSVITVGPQIEIYPGPLLPNLLVRRISEAGIQKLLSMARQEGLLELTGSFDTVGIADAGTAQLTFVTDKRHTISAYALGEGTDDSKLDATTRSARAAMRRFVAALSDLPATLGSEASGTDQPYRATSVRLYITPGEPPADPSLPAQQAHAWPLATPLASFGKPFAGFGADARCGVVTGADLDGLMPALRQANVLTPWLSAGSTFGLMAHPLLPGETGCPPQD